MKEIIDKHTNKIKRININWKLKGKGFRQKAVRYFAGFMLFMFLCTLISRGIYAMRLPQITHTSIESMGLSHEVETVGYVEATAERAVTVQNNLLVSQVLVKQGMAIKAGEVLFCLDMTSLTEAIEALELEIKQLDTRIAALKENENITAQKSELAKARASADQTEAAANSEEAVANAQKELETAQNAQHTFPDKETYIAESKANDATYQSMKIIAEKEDAKQEDKKLFSGYEAELEAKAMGEWTEQNERLAQAVTTQAQALDAAIKARDSAMKAANRALEDAALPSPTDSTLEETQLSRKAVEDKMKKLVVLKKANGEIIAETEGVVKSVQVSVGEKTPDGAAVVIYEVSDTLLFQTEITEEQRKYVELKDEVQLIFNKKKSNGLQVNSITEQLGESGNRTGLYEVGIQVSSKDATIGVSGTMKITKQTDQYDYCVPLASLYSDGSQDFIYIVQEKSTILGTEYTLAKRGVTIIDRNDSFAALDDTCGLTDQDKILTYSSIEVKTGDKVRLKEE